MTKKTDQGGENTAGARMENTQKPMKTNQELSSAMTLPPRKEAGRLEQGEKPRQLPKPNTNQPKQPQQKPQQAAPQQQNPQQGALPKPNANQPKQQQQKPKQAANQQQKPAGQKPQQKPKQAAQPQQKTEQAAKPPQKPAENKPQQNRQPKQKQKQQQKQQPKQQQKQQALPAAQNAAVAQPQQKTAQPARGNNRRRGQAERKKTPLKIIPLGGLNEIGKNMTVYECANDAFIVDCGLAFPDENMLGVDIVIPDFTYAHQIKDKLRGIVLTHGHEDHIGGLVYFLKELNLPVYGTKLTLGLVEGKLKEHGLQNKADLRVIQPRDTVKMGCMSVEFVRVNHSIPDAVAIVTHSPTGIVIQTGDFKIDYTPIEGEAIDLARFGELGNKGVLALLSDSTNAERPGTTVTERKVGQSFESLFKTAEDKRIIIASFSSNIHRIQQICNCAVKFGRKVAVSGRSMENVVGKAIELGYLHVPENLIVEIDMLRNYKPSQIVIITTGSQGEPMAALSRMSSGDHRQISVGHGDFIIISATPIPGNEKFVGRVVNELLRLGAEVIYESMYEVHVSGHACQEELKLMLSLTHPKFFMPVHGEYKHLKKHSELALGMGIPPENIIIGEIGRVIETDAVTIKTEEVVPSGRVMVDGLGVGDVGSIVLRDRKHLALDGLLIIVVAIDTQTGEIVSGPDIVSRGFVYVRESEELIDTLRDVAKQVLYKNVSPGNAHDWNDLKTQVREKVSQCVYHKTKRSPMILPIVMEV